MDSSVSNLGKLIYWHSLLLTVSFFITNVTLVGLREGSIHYSVGLN